MGVHLEAIEAEILCKNTAEHGQDMRAHKLLDPHEVFAAAYEAGPSVFQKMFGVSGLLDFWLPQQDQAWVVDHPGMQSKDFVHAIPIGVHADKGQHIHRDKMLNIGWGSVTSRSETIWSKNMFTILPDELLIKGVTDEALYSILVWSLEVMRVGVWPKTDHTGKPWPIGSRRQLLGAAERRLAGDFFCVFSEYRGDWEWSVETFQWRLRHVKKINITVRPVRSGSGFGRPRRPRQPFQKAGGEDPHLLACFVRLPGPPKHRTSTNFGRPKNHVIQNPSVLTTRVLLGPRWLWSVKLFRQTLSPTHLLTPGRRIILGVMLFTSHRHTGVTDTTFVATATGPPNPCTTSCTPIGQTVHCGEPLIFQIMLMHRSLGLAVSCRP